MVAKTRKKWSGKKKLLWTAGVVIGCGVMAGGILFWVKSQSLRAMAEVAAVQSAVAEKGSIMKTVIGSGSLESDSALNVLLPTGLKMKEVLVESGDHVEAGDILATVDEASLNNELTSIQEEIAALDQEISAAKDDTDGEGIETKVAGRVKKLYGEADQSVADVMLAHGALAILSIGGKMAVTLENVSGVSKGGSVEVVRPDGTTKTGTVDSLDGAACTITLTDNDPELEEKVTVQDKDGKELGTGTLWIYESLAITGTSGTIDEVSVSEDESVSAGSVLFTLADTALSLEYEKLTAQRKNWKKSCRSCLPCPKRIPSLRSMQERCVM